MTLNSIGFQLSWIMLVSADIPKPAKPRACALSAHAVRELLQAGPSCLNTVITAGSHLLLITGGGQGAIWGDGTVIHSAHPSAFICSLSLQHRGAFDVLIFFLNWGKIVVVVLCELFSEKMFYPNNSLHFGISPLLTLSFVHPENTCKRTFLEKKQKRQRRKTKSTKSLSQSSQVYHPKACI